MSLQAGAAQVDITPQPGSYTLEKNSLELQGWRVAIDPLYARALVLENHGRKLCLVATDLNSVDRRCSTEIKEQVARQCGLNPNAIMIHATQIHSGPQLGYPKDTSDFLTRPPDFWKDLSSGDDAYRTRTVAQIVKVIETAHDNLKPARLGAASGIEGRVAFNRRMVMRDGSIGMPLFSPREQFRYLEGPIDPELGVVSILTDALHPSAFILNYTCHPVSLHPERYKTTISADWPGALANQLQQTFGAPVVPLVLNGACGNINSWDGYDPEYTRDHQRMGRILADTARQVIESLDYQDDIKLDWRLSHLKLPWRQIDPKIVQECQAFLKEHPEPYLSDQSPKAVDPRWTHCATVVDLDQRRQRETNYDYEIQVLRLGKVAFVLLPGEPFVESGLKIKMASPFFPTYVVHHPWWPEGAYLPTQQAFERGGYETDIVLAKFVPESLDMIIDQAVNLLKEIY